MLSFMLASHHQVAAVDVERRAGDVAGRLRCGEADQVGNFERGAEARNRIARRRGASSSSGDAFSRVSSVSIMPGQTAFTVMPNLPELLRRRARQARAGRPSTRCSARRRAC